MRILKPAIQYRRTADGMEEPIPTPELGLPSSSRQIPQQDIQIDYGVAQTLSHYDMNRGPNLSQMTPSMFAFSPPPPARYAAVCYNSPDGNFDRTSETSSEVFSLLSPSSSSRCVSFASSDVIPGVSPDLSVCSSSFSPRAATPPHYSYSSQFLSATTSDVGSVSPPMASSSPRLLPNEVLLTGAEDPWTRNAVEASYWEELRRLFPAMPSSGRRLRNNRGGGGAVAAATTFSEWRRSSHEDGYSLHFSPLSSPQPSPLPLPPSNKEVIFPFIRAPEKPEYSSTDDCADDCHFRMERGTPWPSIRDDGGNGEISPLMSGLEKIMRPLAMQTETKLLRSHLDAVTKSFEKNGRTVLFDEIDAKQMQSRRSALGLGDDEFFDRSVAVTDLIRPSQRLGINSKEAWSHFRRQSESSTGASPSSAANTSDGGNVFVDPSPSSDRLSHPARQPRGGGKTASISDAAVTERRCNFCFNNKEPIEVWSSHDLKDGNGKISCHILRKYVCPRCGASGDKAHTNRYCPKNKGEEANVSSIKDLNTGRTSAGRFSMNAAKR